MKRVLVLLVLVALCMVPAQAETNGYYVNAINANVFDTNYFATNPIVGYANISSITSLVIVGIGEITYNEANDRSGSFILKNATNTTIATGTFSSVFSDVSHPLYPARKTRTHTFSFSGYDNHGYTGSDTFKMYFSTNGWWYCNDAGINGGDSGKSTFGLSNYIAGNYTFNYVSTTDVLVANFTGAPLAGVAPLNTAFTDTSENEYGTCTYNWTITPLTNVTGATGTLENHAATFNDAGNYTVSHGVSCGASSSVSTKTNYIWVYAPNETETTYFYTYNPLSGYEIHNSNIYLNDIENGSWVNSTDDADGRLGITALSTHHINAYSDKEGFGDGELLNQLASGLSYPLIMFPSNVTNVSAGNVTLYINVIDTWAPGTPVSGATVSITYAWPAIQYGTTNEAGMISFTVPNNTLIQVAANKAGYTGVSDSVNSGTGSGGEASVSKTLYITKKTVTTAPTQTTLPGGGTPTPQVTYLAHCDPSAADYDEALCRSSKGGVGLNILADYMDDLILLCIFVTIMYLLGFKLGS